MKTIESEYRSCLYLTDNKYFPDYNELVKDI